MVIFTSSELPSGIAGKWRPVIRYVSVGPPAVGLTDIVQAEGGAALAAVGTAAPSAETMQMIARSLRTGVSFGVVIDEAWATGATGALAGQGWSVAAQLPATAGS
jgi:hypothetical protein